MSTAKARTAHAKTILGDPVQNYMDASLRPRSSLGAGGIGCELRSSFALVENIVLTGFGKITLLDLDTIDLTDLNRQFLFRQNRLGLG
ncbi:hypothetical protein C8F04DRAFT_1278077 [Mycena alexandri]|uniref:THIF-type NAD/FAD binding fold domain-containing protein n=1 Tax=Mycena alexandri TaxID=1745969 RepID=A0AAD6S0B4_9AGAR|nr:hypothetical protein C8F04DRAFT_1278077 [Mycena alexandri]